MKGETAVKKAAKTLLSVLLVVCLLTGTSAAAYAKTDEPTDHPPVVCREEEPDTPPQTDPESDPDPDPEPDPEPTPDPEPEPEMTFRQKLLDFWLLTAEALEEGFHNMFEAIISLPRGLLLGAGWILFYLAFPFMVLYAVIQSALQR